MTQDERMRQEEQGFADHAAELLDRWIADWQRRQGPGYDAMRDPLVRRAYKAAPELIIGRLDLTEDRTYYVGKINVTKHRSSETIVMDWRAPFASRFYQASRVEPQGVGRRRSIRMQRGRVTHVGEDVLVPGFRPASTLLAPEVVQPPGAPEPLAARSATGRTIDAGHRGPSDDGERHTTAPDPVPGVAASRPELRAEDLLLQELTDARTNELRDIVATLQADQDRLIRSDGNRPLLIQGGPGTGKTAVGLHRAAYLLYSRSDDLSRTESLLVVGPSERFIDYIRNVLPSLGEASAVHRSIDDLAMSKLSQSERRAVRATVDDLPLVSALKGDARMAAVIERALWSFVRPRKITVDVGSITVGLPEREVDRLVRSLRGEAYQTASTKLRKQIIDALRDRYIEIHRRRHGLTPQRAELTTALQQLERSGDVQAIMSAPRPLRLVQDLLGDAELLARCARGLFSADQVRSLQRAPDRGHPRWSSADLALLDEAAWQLRQPPQSYDHIVVDEAQDLTAMQWRVVMRRAKTRSVTVLGDIAQSSAPGSAKSWDDVIRWAELVSPEIAQLNVGYRVPAEIMDFAGRLLPDIAPELPPLRSIRQASPPDIRRVASQAALEQQLRTSVEDALERGGLTAVIAPDDWVRANLASTLNPAVHVLGPSESKGLEFDNVIVVEPAAFGTTRDGQCLLYTALTRATKHLTVVHKRSLPPALRATTKAPTATYTPLFAAAGERQDIEPNVVGHPDDVAINAGVDLAMHDDEGDSDKHSLALEREEELSDEAIDHSEPEEPVVAAPDRSSGGLVTRLRRLLRFR